MNIADSLKEQDLALRLLSSTSDSRKCKLIIVQDIERDDCSSSYFYEILDYFKRNVALCNQTASHLIEQQKLLVLPQHNSHRITY